MVTSHSKALQGRLPIALLGFAALLATSSAAACLNGFPERFATCNPRCSSPSVRRPLVPYEPMFDSKKTLTGRLTDAADLLIDFATLGEYGLEPVGRTRRAARPATAPSAPASRAPARRPAP